MLLLTTRLFSYIPIVALALVFNLTNVIGFTYAYAVSYLLLSSSLTMLFLGIAIRSKDGLIKSLAQAGISV